MGLWLNPILLSMVFFIGIVNAVLKSVNLSSSYPFPEDMDMKGAPRVDVLLRKVIKENGTINTKPFNITKEKDSKLVLHSPNLPDTTILSGDWITIQSVQFNSLLSSPSPPRCFRRHQDLCDAKLDSVFMNIESPDTEKFQIFIKEWNDTSKIGRVAFKDNLGRWVTTGPSLTGDSSVIFISQKNPVITFDEVMSSAFQSFYITNTEDMNGYFQIYRNFTMDEQGRTEAIYFNGSSWTLAPPSMTRNPILDLVLTPVEGPPAVELYEEVLINTRFDLASQQDQIPVVIANLNVCNEGPANETVQVTYSFSPTAIFEAKTERLSDFGVSGKLNFEIPWIEGNALGDNSLRLDGTVGLSWKSKIARGWWNMTTTGQNTFVNVPPLSSQQVKVIAQYDYDRSLPWTATYTRKFLDGSVFTYEIKGTWNRASYWDAKIVYMKTVNNITNCTYNDTFS